MSDIVQLLLTKKVTPGTSQEWSASTSIIPDGYICVEVDTYKGKIGNGLATYNELAYSIDLLSSPNATIKNFTARSIITKGDVVALYDAGSVVTISNPDYRRCRIGIALEDAVVGFQVPVVIFGGIVTDTNLYSVDLLDNKQELVVGHMHYIKENGKLTHIVNEFPIGRALTKDTLYITHGANGTIKDPARPTRPTNLEPVNGSTIDSVTPVLLSSSYISNTDDDYHTAIQFQISNEPSFTNIIFNKQVSSPVVAYKVGVQHVNLVNGTNYYWRCRHRGFLSWWSDWSLPTMFKVQASSGKLVWTSTGLYRFTVPANMNNAKLSIIPDFDTSSFGDYLKAEVSSWEYIYQTPSTIFGRVELGTTAHNELLYIVGGKRGGTETALDDVYTFNYSTYTWSTLTILPKKLYALGCTTTPNGDLYIAGGRNTALSNSTYRHRNNNITTLANMPNARCNHAMAADDSGNVYVFGGSTTLNNDATAQILMFNPANNTWTNKTSLLTARRNATAVSVGTKIYIVGGYNTSGVRISTVEIYDTVSNTCSYGPSLPHTVADAAGALDPITGSIIITGGTRLYSGAKPSLTPLIFRLSPKAPSTWTVLGTLRAPMASHGCGITSDGSLYTVGGTLNAIAFSANPIIVVNKLNLHNNEITISNEQGVCYSSGFDIGANDEIIPNGEAKGINSGIMCWRDDVTLLEGDIVPIKVGFPSGFVKLEWGDNVNKPYQLFNHPGVYDYKPPREADRIKATVVPDNSSSTFDTIVGGIADGYNNNDIAFPVVGLLNYSVTIDNNNNIYVCNSGTATGLLAYSSRVAYKYDAVTKKWTNIANTLVSRFNNKAICDSLGNVYLLGGNSSTSDNKYIEVYDPTTGIWTNKADITTLSGGTGAGFNVANISVTMDKNDNLYILGTRTFMKYDTRNNTLIKLNGASNNLVPGNPDYKLTGDICYDGDDTIYHLGGTVDSTAPSTSIFKYSISSNTWMKLSNVFLPSTPVLKSCSNVYIDDKIYVFANQVDGVCVNLTTSETKIIKAPSQNNRGPQAYVNSNNNILVFSTYEYAGRYPSVTYRVSNGLDIYGEDEVYTSTDGFTISDTDHTTPGPYGKTSNTLLVHNNHKTDFDKVYRINVGSDNGLVKLAWTDYNNPANIAIFTSPGMYSFAAPDLVDTVKVTIIPTLGMTSFNNEIYAAAIKNGNDIIIDSNGLVEEEESVNGFDVYGNGKFDYGKISKVKCVAYSVAIDRDSNIPISIGGPDGALIIEWGYHAARVGEQLFDTPGTHTFTVPDDVTSVNVLGISCGAPYNVDKDLCGGGGGLGWKNNIPVTPGAEITIIIGTPGSTVDNPIGDIKFGDVFHVRGAINDEEVNIPGKMITGDGGHLGGNGSKWGAGGCAGYHGRGGTSGATAISNGINGSGGSAGGGCGNESFKGAGGGVGILGQGSNGKGGNINAPAPYTAFNGTDGSTYGDKTYGAGGSPTKPPTGGAIRIVWGNNRLFPDAT